MKTFKTIIYILLMIIFLLYLIPKGGSPINKAKFDSTRPKMVPVESAIEKYKQNTGHLPEKLEDLVTCPIGLESVWQSPYLKKSQLYDPWDRPYVYELNQNDPNSYTLISYGKDGKSGGKKYNADIYND